MAKNDITARYTLAFHDKASKGILTVAAASRTMAKGLAIGGAAVAAFGAAAGGAAIKIANNFSERADEVAKFSKQVEISADTLQRYETIASLQGASIENYKSGVEKFTKSMGEMRGGTGTLISVLGKVDPALAAQLKSTKSNEEAVNLAIKSLSEYTDVQKQAAVASALFGRSGGADFMRIVEGGADALAEMQKQADRVRPPLSQTDLKNAEKYNDSVFLAKQALGSLSDTIGAKLMPILTPLIEKFTEFVIANRELIGSKASEFFDRMANGVSGIDLNSLLTNVADIAMAAGDLARIFLSVSGALSDMLGGPGNAMKVFVGLFVGAKILSFASAIGGVGTKLAALTAFMAKTKIAGLAMNAAIRFLPMLFGPVGIAIGLVVGAGYLLWKNWDWISAKASELMDWLSYVWDNIPRYIGIAIDKAIQFGSDLIMFYLTLPAKMAKIGLQLLQKLGEGIANGASFVYDKIVQLAANIKAKFVEYFSNIDWSSIIFAGFGGVPGIAAKLALNAGGGKRAVQSVAGGKTNVNVNVTSRVLDSGGKPMRTRGQPAKQVTTNRPRRARGGG